MIKDKPIRAECYKEILDRHSQIRDLLNEIEQLLSFAVNEDKVLLTSSEVAAIFKCDKKRIPKAIPRMRLNGDSYYLKSDVYGYIDSKLKKAY